MTTSDKRRACIGCGALDPPQSLGEITVLDVYNAEDAASHVAIVNRWARAVWQAWAAHHAMVREWAAPPKG